MPSGDWRQIHCAPTTLCGHYFSKHPAVLIMSVLPPTVSSLSGFCLPRSAEGEASTLMAPNRFQMSRGTVLFMYAIAQQPDFIWSISEHFYSLKKEGVACPWAAVAINHQPAPSLSMPAVLQTLQSFYILEAQRGLWFWGCSSSGALIGEIEIWMPGNYDSDAETLSLHISPPGLVTEEPNTDIPLPSQLATVPSEAIVSFACAHLCRL